MTRVHAELRPGVAARLRHGDRRDRGIAAAALTAASFALTACAGASFSPLGPQGLNQTAQVTTHGSRASCPCLYVANRGTPNRVTVYASGAHGRAAPVEDITGTSTGLNDPWGVALDSSGNIYVTNSLANSVTEYAAGANGNASPIATISGPATNFDEPAGITLDGSNKIYVSSYSNSTVEVFAAGASGNATPLQTLGGSATNLYDPLGIAVDAGLNIYVVSSFNNRVLVFAAGANGNATPIQDISGSSTKLNTPAGLTLDGSDDIYVANTGDLGPPYSVTVYAAGANGNVAPTRYITGINTKLKNPYGIARDSSGRIHVADYGRNSVTTYAAAANGNVRPTSVLKGQRTKLSTPVGIVIR
jgi:hypothetical protein